MTQNILQVTSTLAAVLATLAVIFSGICAFFSYRLAKKVKDELESDDRIVVGVPIHPGLREPDHDNCVLRCTLFNKSKRKAHIQSVKAFDSNGKELDVTWASEIDSFGNPQNPFQLIGIVDSSNLYVRRNDGESIDYMCLSVTHSFPGSPLEIIYDPINEWIINGEGER